MDTIEIQAIKKNNKLVLVDLVLQNEDMLPKKLDLTFKQFK